MERMEEGNLELELVGRAAAGDEGAFRTLVDRHARMVFNLAYRITTDRPSAEDVVQETFLRAYRALHRFDGRAAFSTWLHRIAMNASLDHVRQRKVRAEVGGARRANEREERVVAEAGDEVGPLPAADEQPHVEGERVAAGRTGHLALRCL